MIQWSDSSALWWFNNSIFLIPDKSIPPSIDQRFNSPILRQFHATTIQWSYSSNYMYVTIVRQFYSLRERSGSTILRRFNGPTVLISNSSILRWFNGSTVLVLRSDSFMLRWFRGLTILKSESFMLRWFNGPTVQYTDDSMVRQLYTAMIQQF